MNESRCKSLLYKRFGKLIVIEETAERRHRKIVWRCLCDCGNTTYVTTNDLNSGNTKSCGCGKVDYANNHEHNNPTFIENTQVCMLSPDVTFKNNTSGYRGVSKLKNGKYRASIKFKKQVYHLGTFSNLEDAVEERKRAEKQLFDPFLRKYQLNEKEKMHS